MASENKTAETYIEKPRTLAAVRAEILSGNTKATDLANTYYERIGQINPRLNVYLSLTKERALAQAARIDELRRLGIRAYLRKPFRPESFREVVTDVLGTLDAVREA